MNEQIHSIHTPCKECVFAKYENITQVDCELDYIEKYKQSGAEILEAYDNNKEFYVINDKKCIGYRENKWFTNIGMGDATIEQKVQHYKDNNKLHYLIVINLKNFTLDQLKDCFKELSEAAIKPQKIIIVRYRDPESVFNYKTIEDIINSSNIKCGWRIQSMLDDSISYAEILHNITAINQKYRFIMSVAEPAESFAYLIDYANNLVHEKLDQFIVISNPSKNVVLYSGGVYRFGAVHNQNILTEYDKYTIL